MYNRLSVAIDGPEIADDPGAYEATAPFLLGIDNQGRATHVHVAVEGALETTDGAPDANHFVDSGETQELLVDVAPAPAEGTITVATGHGADETTVSVTIVSEQDGSVVSDDGDPPETEIAVQENIVFVAATAVLAVLLAAAAVVFIGNVVVTLGAVVVIVATATGVGYLLTR